jgi:uncharacterized phage protein (TIGR01671 family)
MEIKFKVWDNQSKHWVYFHNDDDLTEPVLLTENNFVIEPYNNYHKADYVYCMFTGLQDKNGKDIYEGDVIKIELNNNAKYQVIWRNEFADFFLSNIKSSIGTYFHSDGDCLEIIGNIHENPEILERNNAG